MVHDQLRDEDVLLDSIDYYNCNGKQLAERYGLGALMNSLKDMYKGELILLGNPRLKPHDIIVIADDYNGVAGPIEIEEVTHIFTPDQGFISIVVPDALVIAHEYR